MVKQMQETYRQMQETGRQLKELEKKFGNFTEGLALPSMTKIFSERFGMEVVSPSVRVKKQGENMEIEVLAYANSGWCLTLTYKVEPGRKSTHKLTKYDPKVPQPWLASVLPTCQYRP